MEPSCQFSPNSQVAMNILSVSVKLKVRASQSIDGSLSSNNPRLQNDSEGEHLAFNGCDGID